MNAGEIDSLVIIDYEIFLGRCGVCQLRHWNWDVGNHRYIPFQFPTLVSNGGLIGAIGQLKLALGSIGASRENYKVIEGIFVTAAIDRYEIYDFAPEQSFDFSMYSSTVCRI